jgi:membrane-bound lytic murein transglycosylase D
LAGPPRTFYAHAVRVASLVIGVLFSGSAFAAGTKPQAKPAQQASTQANAQIRRQIAGGPTADDANAGVESPELAELRAAERELFPPAAPAIGSAWPSELPAWRESRESGLSTPPESRAPPAEGERDLSWLGKLTLPDLPVRFDARVVRYLELYKDDQRARAALGVWRRRAGRYKDAIERVLRRKNLPLDLAWLAMIESGFDATARSPAGAVGLWQFMPETGKLYGLPQDRFVDERIDVTAETEAAADFLSDLHRRFGSWDLAMASYNMGYAGIVAAERRYNTNDFWALSKLEGSLPWETTLYVPKILAAAVVMKNLAAFGLDTITPDAPITFDEVRAPFGVSLSAIAQAANLQVKELEALNPELRASRTPPKESDVAQAVLGTSIDRGWNLRVPTGRAEVVTASLSKIKREETALDRYVVRFGETLDQVAQSHGTTNARLAEINGIAPGELVHGGSLILVPHGTPHAATTTTTVTNVDKPVAVVQPDLFVYPGRKRVFYKVLVGDGLKELADALHVTIDELRKWNDIDPSARLQEGMMLQAFVADGADLSKIAVLAENDVRILTTGSDELFAYYEKTRHRFVITARAGETVDAIGKRFGVSGALMERINRRSRSDVLRDGETVVVYVASTQNASTAPASTSANLGVPTPSGACVLPPPSPLGPLPRAPRPDLLPPTRL